MTSKFSHVTRIDSPGFLELDLPHQLFGVLDSAFQRYRAARSKSIEDAFLLVLGIAHLREWIAPGYKGQRTPRNPAERFSDGLFALDTYQTILHVANHAKHQFRDENLVTKSVHYTNVDDWPDVDSVGSFDSGPVLEHFVGEKRLTDLVEVVLQYYRQYWFDLSDDEQMGTREERMHNVLEEDRNRRK